MFETLPALKYSENDLRELRESLGLLQKIIPFDVTLSTADTAQDIINLNSFHPPAMNLVLNPSFENGLTGWTKVGDNGVTIRATGVRTISGGSSCWIERSSVSSSRRYGIAYELKDLPPGSYGISAQVASNVAPHDMLIRWSVDGGNTFQEGDPVTTISTDWRQISAMAFVDYGQTLRVEIISEDLSTGTQRIALVEHVQVEPDWRVVMGFVAPNDPYGTNATISEFVNPWHDRMARWLGDANNSVSIREPGIREITRVSIIPRNNQDVIIDFDRTAAMTGGRRGIPAPSGFIFNENLIIKERISFINYTAGETPRVEGYVMGH